MSARTVTHDGQTLTIRQWASRSNLSPFVLRYRLDAGWPVALALSTPLHSCGRKPVSNVRSAVQEREARAFNAKAGHVRSEFDKLVNNIDRALTAFNSKINWLLSEEADTGGYQPISENEPFDRTTRTAQDGA